MSNFTDFFPAGGASAYPRVVSFSSSGSWVVPEAITSKITSDGGCNIYTNIIGAGNSTRGGEVVSEILRLTSSDYKPSNEWANPNNPEIGVVIGVNGQSSGFGVSPGSGTSRIDSSSITGYSASTTVTLSSPYLVSNLAQITELRAGFAQSSPTRSFTWSGTTQPTSSSIVNSEYRLQWSTATPFNGVLTVNGSGGGYGTSTSTLTYNSSTQVVTYAMTGQYGSTSVGTSTIFYKSDGLNVLARGGSSTDHKEFPNNPTSTEGYLGFSRFNAETKGSGGSDPTGGYIEFYYYE